MDAQEIYTKVAEHYSSAAKTSSSGYGRSIAKSFGYSDEDLAAIPAGANLGLSCGNPLAIASLKTGETVVDLGSGAGFDVFQAANKVGPTGKVIGIDMNKDMLALAEKNRASGGYSHVEFMESMITEIGIDSGVADCIISNCVINLIPEPQKHLVFQEIFRLLKPGGRVAISDILTKKPLPQALATSVALYVGCVAGASQVADYQRYLKDAGFCETLIIDTGADLNIYVNTNQDVEGPDSSEDNKKGCCPGAPSTCCRRDTEGASTSRRQCCPSAEPTCCTQPEVPEGDITSEDGLVQLKDVNLNEWVGSFSIFAVKP